MATWMLVHLHLAWIWLELYWGEVLLGCWVGWFFGSTVRALRTQDGGDT